MVIPAQYQITNQAVKHLEAEEPDISLKGDKKQS